MTRRRKWLLGAAGALAGIAGLLALAAIATLRSQWFHDRVRDRIIAEVERATGGDTEIGAFEFDWKTMTARVKPFTLHGKEQGGEAPFLRMEGIEVGLKVVSAFRRDVDIATLIVDRPRVNIIIYPDGSNNLPSPRERREGKNPLQRLIDLQVGRLELRDGLFTLREERIPFDIRAAELRALLDFAPQDSYAGRVSSRRFVFNSPGHVGPLPFDFDTDVKVFAGRIELPRVTLSAEGARVEASGSLSQLARPAGHLDFTATAALDKMGKPLRVPVEHRGTADVRGTVDFSFEPKFAYTVRGRLNARGLAYRKHNVRVENARASADLEVSRSGLRATNANAASAAGSFSGVVELRDFRDLSVRGRVAGVSLAEVARSGGSGTLPWSGVAAGSLVIAGVVDGGGIRNFSISTDVSIAPAEGGIPVSGHAAFAFSERAGLRLGPSDLETPNTQVRVSGAPGQELEVSFRSTDLGELRPALQWAGRDADIPVVLKNGVATANLRVTGPVQKPLVTGAVSLTSFEWNGRRVDSADARIAANSASLSLSDLRVRQNGMNISGAVELGLSDWKPVAASPVSANLRVAGADAARLLADAGRKDLAVAGSFSGTVRVSGAYGAPQVEAQLESGGLKAFGEQISGLRAQLRAARNRVDVLSSEIRIGEGRIAARGSYSWREGDPKSGSLRFEGSGTALPLAAVDRIRRAREDLTATASFKVSGSAHLDNGEFNIAELQGDAGLQSLALDNTRFGNLRIAAETHGQTLDVTIGGNVRESKVTGTGRWQLAGEYPGQAEVRFSPLRIATLKLLASAAAGAGEELPFEGVLEGGLRISGPLNHPSRMSYRAALDRVEIRPLPEQRIRAGARAQDLSLSNDGPVVFRGDSREVTVERARFTAKETQVEVLGTVTFNDRSPWDVSLHGGINLAILQLFNADLVATGKAVVNASLKGALRDPQLTGSLQLADASLYLGDLPVGVDHASGSVRFDRNRATIQQLTAEIGGGRVILGGFVGFGGGLLAYRVQASAEQVRLRYPEGVSTTLNCALNLTGTSANSLVSGTVTVLRAGFTPKADVASIIAASAANPISTPETPNEFLRTIQLDVRIESGPGLEVATSLARDVEADAELRLRGTAARPLLLGTVSVTEGEINLFGNKYEINRGEIRFLNVTRIEPFFDVDLQTRARGIDVTISFSGTLNKLNMTYRSDPPLQSSEIVALLAMGRDPTAAAGLASAQVASQSLLQSGSGALGQAISAPVSSRLQRFFGVSRLKIDPQLTGVENIPQARLTLEQQISRDITLTYITNLARTNEQIVRVQWDINRRWSAIATRQENGVFGIDFQYRKRFK